jgi:hypothetical protein
MKKFLLVVLASFFFLQISVSETEAAFGISPAEITIDYLSPGMEVDKEFLISRTELNSDADIVVEPDIPGADSWVKIDPDVAFTIPKGQRTKTMKVVITVPQNAPYKSYEGYLNVKVGGVGKTSGVTVVEGVAISVNLSVTKEKISKMLIRKIEIPTTEEGKPIRLLVSIENQGNQEIKPDKFSLLVKNSFGIEVMNSEYTKLANVSPGKLEDAVAEFENKLTKGEYKADVSITYNGQEIKKGTIAFRVEKKQEFKSAGLNGKTNLKILVFLLSIVLVSSVIVAVIWFVLRRKIVI